MANSVTSTKSNKAPHDADVASGLDAKMDDHYQKQSTARVALLLTSVMVNMFLVALDRMIVATVCSSPVQYLDSTDRQTS